MLKKIMVAFMTACLLLRSSALIYLLVQGRSELPVIILGTTAMVCTVFGVLLFRYFSEGIKRRDMEIAFILNALVVLFNMMCVRFGTPATISTFELMTMGTLFEIVAGVTFVVLSKQRTRYITIPRI